VEVSGRVEKRFVAAACAAFAGCGVTIAETPLHPPPRPMTARAADRVDLFAGDGPPARPYVEVSELSEDPQTAFGDQPYSMVTKMREQAGELGCDGLVVTGVRQEAIGGQNSRLIGRCIMYTSP
jgi:hypothetical protein